MLCSGPQVPTARIYQGVTRRSALLLGKAQAGAVQDGRPRNGNVDIFRRPNR
jgi:hypothetical protein